MKKKDFYIGVLIIAIALHILGFITSPHNFGDFETYLSWSPIIRTTFYMEVWALAIIVIWEIIRAMLSKDEKSKKEEI